MALGLVISKDKTSLKLMSSDSYIALTEATMEKFLAQFGIIHLPEFYYQLMWQAAPRNEDDLEAGQKRGRDILMGFMEEHYPNYDLGSFVDLSTVEAKALHPLLTWGLWIQLVPKRPTEDTPILDSWELKKIFDGKRIGYSNE
jgi:hypothetical protein